MHLQNEIKPNGQVSIKIENESFKRCHSLYCRSSKSDAFQKHRIQFETWTMKKTDWSKSSSFFTFKWSYLTLFLAHKHKTKCVWLSSSLGWSIVHHMRRALWVGVSLELSTSTFQFYRPNSITFLKRCTRRMRIAR